MSKKDVTFQYCDEIIDQFEKVCKHPIVEKSSVYYAGVDLGTACILSLIHICWQRLLPYRRNRPETK